MEIGNVRVMVREAEAPFYLHHPKATLFALEPNRILEEFSLLLTAPLRRYASNPTDSGYPSGFETVLKIQLI